MEELHIIGVDLAKRVFQVHGSDRAGRVLFRKKLSRPQFKKFLCEIPNCTIAMEACATSHHWGREAEEAGHIVRLNPRRIYSAATVSGMPSAVKPLRMPARI